MQKWTPPKPKPGLLLQQGKESATRNVQEELLPTSPTTNSIEEIPRTSPGGGEAVTPHKSSERLNPSPPPIPSSSPPPLPLPPNEEIISSSSKRHRQSHGDGDDGNDNCDDIKIDPSKLDMLLRDKSPEYQEVFLREFHACLRKGREQDRQTEQDERLKVKHLQTRLEEVVKKTQREEEDLVKIRGEIQQAKNLLDTFAHARRIVKGDCTLEERDAYVNAAWIELKRVREKLASVRHAREMKMQQYAAMKKPTNITVEDEDREKCQICLDTIRDTVWTGCGHMYCCHRCAAKMAMCPVCKNADGFFLRLIAS